LDLPEITEVWRRGSVIGSWLLDLTAIALLEDPGLKNFESRLGIVITMMVMASTKTAVHSMEPGLAVPGRC